MADPTATFILTAKDQTAAAIKSAEGNFKSLVGTVKAARTLFAGFGVALAGRAFANWIEGAITANDLTAEQALKVKDAKAALDSYKESSRDLAVSFAQELTPAIEAASAVMIGWNRILFGADPFPFEQQINSIEHQIRGLEAAIGSSFGADQAYQDNLKKMLEDANKQLEDFLKKQRDAMDAQGKALHDAPFLAAAQKSAQDFLDKHGKLEVKLTPVIDLSELDTVIRDQQLDALQFDTEAIKNLALPELDFMPEFETQAKHAADEASKDFEEVGKTLGRGLHDSLVDFIVDGEASFKQFLKRLAAEVVVSGIFDLLSTAAGGPTSFFGSIFGGFKANGGPLEQGKWYVAGERGPEPVWGGGPGAFAYAGGGMSSGPVQVQIDQHFSTDLTPDQALAMGRVVAQSVYSALKKEQSGRR